MNGTIDHCEVDAALRLARIAAAAWRDVSVRQRLRIIRRARHLIAARATAFAETLGGRRPIADTLTAELLPLLAGARFLERRAEGILAPRALRGGRPLWLFGVVAEIRREPCGVVLILGPANYPLFLPGAQILQAVAAGNAVCVKPAPGCGRPLRVLAAVLMEAGLPENVLQILPESAATGSAAVAAGFDRIVLTGSAQTGRAVLAAAAPRLTPTTMELSGNDAVFVLQDADVAAVAAMLSYGLRLNDGGTCIAPRRVFVVRAQAEALAEALLSHVATLPPPAIPPTVLTRLEALVTEAVAAGARRLTPVGGGSATSPVIIADAKPEMRLLQEDVFAPWLAFVPVADMEEALRALACCKYALGASVFGPEKAARPLAARIPVGSVCINDLIVPTADARLPFGGRGSSGFGVTRGAEGLLEMTVIKTVSARRGRFKPHLAPPRAGDEQRIARLIAALYASPRLGWRVFLRR